MHPNQFQKYVIVKVKRCLRYYNSWIETIKCLKDDVSVTSSNPTSPESKASETFASKNSLGLSGTVSQCCYLLALAVN